MKLSVTLSKDKAQQSRLVVMGLALVAAVFLLAAMAWVLAGGSLTRLAMVGMVAVIPFLTFLAVKRPVVFPLGIYILSVPLNDILYFPQFGTLSKLIGVVTFAALAFWIVRNRVIVKPSVTVWAWAAVVVWMGMTGMWALQRADWWQLLPTLIQLVCLYALICVTPVSAADLRVSWFAIVAGGLLAALVGLYDFFFSKHVTWLNGNTTEVISHAFDSSRLWVSTASGDVADPNHYAGALLLPIVIVVGAALQQRSWWPRIALTGCFLTLMFALYMSGSRDALIALGLALGYLVWMAPQRKQLLALAAVAAVAAIPLYASLAQRFAIAASTGGAGRLVIWHVGLTALKDYGIFGAGLGNFPDVYFQRYLWVYTPTPMPWGVAGHNLLLTSTVELGAVGLVLMLGAWSLQFFINRDIRPGDQLYVWRISLEASLIALFVTSMFLDNMIRKYTWLVFAAMALLRAHHIMQANLQEARSRTRIGVLVAPASDTAHTIPLP